MRRFALLKNGPPEARSGGDAGQRVDDVQEAPQRVGLGVECDRTRYLFDPADSPLGGRGGAHVTTADTNTT